MSQGDIYIKDLNIAKNFLKEDDKVEINLLGVDTISVSAHSAPSISPSNHAIHTPPFNSQTISHDTGTSFVADNSTVQTSSAPNIIPVNQPPQATPHTVMPSSAQPAPAFSDIALQQRLTEVSQSIRAYNAMEAYSTVYSTPFGLCTRDRNRRDHIVLPLHFQRCIYVEVEPNSLLQQKPFYRISFTENPIPLIISQRDFEKTSKLILALEQHYKTSINLCGPKGKIYNGIRSFLARETQHEKFDFFWGWKLDNQIWKYRLSNGKTHGDRSSLPENYIPCSERINNNIRERVPASVQLTAAIQAAEIINTISDITLRSIIWNIIHIASLYTLICHYVGIPFGFCFCSENTQPLSMVEEMLSWFQDSPVLLSNEKFRFYQQLTERKDQPLLIHDAEAQIQNSKMVEQAITTGIITYNTKTESTLKALPVVLSNTFTHLSQSSQLIRIDIHNDVFSLDANRIICEKKNYLMDYLYYFNDFVQDNQEVIIAKFTNQPISLRNIQQVHALSSESAALFGIIHAVEEIIHLFLTSLSPYESAKELFDGLSSDEMHSFLLDALICLSCRDSDTTICEIFFNTAKQMIHDGCFDIREFGNENNFSPCSTDKQGILYIFKNDPCFTKKAYDAVCNRTGYSYRTVINALMRTNSFKGPSTNSNTPQYRIAGFNPLTQQDYTAVYWLSNEKIPLPPTPRQPEDLAWAKDSSECDITLQLGYTVDNLPIIWNGRENSHICISGLSGSGKSYFLKKLITQLPSQNVRCIIFDTSGDFSSTSQDKHPPEWPVSDLETIDMSSSQAQKLFFKLLSPNDTVDKVIYRFVDILNRKNHLGRKQISSLVACLKSGFERNQLTSFDDLLQIVNQMFPYSAVGDAIKKLDTLLPYGKQDFDWHLDTPGITVLGFQNGFDDDSTKNAIELLLSNICATRMYLPQDDYPPVVLVFDECQLYDWKRGAYTYDIMVRGRKYGLSAWLSTQALSLINNPEIPEQANLRVCFKPTDNEIPQIVKKFYLSSSKEKEDCKTNLANLVRGQFICKLNGNIHVSQPPQKSNPFILHQ